MSRSFLIALTLVIVAASGSNAAKAAGYDLSGPSEQLQVVDRGYSPVGYDDGRTYVRRSVRRVRVEYAPRYTVYQRATPCQ